MGSHRKMIRKMIFISENPIQNEKSSAKSLPLSIEILGILPKILLPIRAENENPSIQTKIAVHNTSQELSSRHLGRCEELVQIARLRHRLQPAPLVVSRQIRRVCLPVCVRMSVSVYSV